MTTGVTIELDLRTEETTEDGLSSPGDPRENERKGDKDDRDDKTRTLSNSDDDYERIEREAIREEGNEL